MKSRNQTRRRLTINYLAVIMAMSVLFSLIIFVITSNQLNRPLLSPDADDRSPQNQRSDAITQSRIDERNDQTREQIVWTLIFLNLSVLVGGAGLSYFLALRTLRPIEEAIETQNRFVSDASHELRTPLTVLQTSNEVALRKKQLSETKARSVLVNNIVEIEKLRELSDSLLELTQAGHSKVKVESVDIYKLVADNIESMKILAEKKKIVIKNDVQEITVTTNKPALNQILTIILDNAIKYSLQDTSVRISTVQDGKAILLRVHDEGIGIGEDNISHIFDRFYRAESARTRGESSGYGLGLAIAKSISDRQQYKLDVKSELGKGTTFSIRIPL